MAAKAVHVKALIDFYDVKADVCRVKGEEFDVTSARMAELNACGPQQGGVKLVKEIASKAKPEKDGE